VVLAIRSVGRHPRHDSFGMSAVSAASRCMSIFRRSTLLVVRHAGHRTCRNQYFAAITAPMVGENSMGMRRSRRAFHSSTRRRASSKICGSKARRDRASFSASVLRADSILWRLKPMAGSSLNGVGCQCPFSGKADLSHKYRRLSAPGVSVRHQPLEGEISFKIR
jgi:hypothetical protein